MGKLNGIKNLFIDKYYNKCLEKFQEVVKTNRDKAIDWKYAGKSLIALAKTEEGIKYLVKANELDNNDPEIPKDIGNAYLTRKDDQNARKWYRLCLEIDEEYGPAYCNLGIITARSNNHKDAINLFKQAIQCDENLVAAYIGAASSYLALFDLTNAHAMAHKAFTIKNDAPKSNQILGIIYQKQQKLELASKHYIKELKINPRETNTRFNLATVFLERGDVSAAVSQLEMLLTVETKKEYILLLAKAYQIAGNYIKATKLYERLGTKSYDNKLIPFNLGICLIEMGDEVRAVKSLKSAIAMDSRFSDAWAYMSIALYNMRRDEEAKEAIYKCLEIDKSHSLALVSLGLIRQRNSDLNQAHCYTHEPLDNQQNSLNAIIKLTSMYLNRGDFDQALYYCKSQLNSDPNNPDAYMRLGIIYKNLSKFDEAISAFIRSIELKANNAYAFLNIGRIHYEQGKLDKALSYAQKSLELDPNNPATVLDIGIIYLELADIDESLSWTLKAIELNPNNAKARINLGWIYKKRGNYEKAIVNTLNAIALDPENPTAHMNLGNIYEEDGDLDKALSSTLRSLAIKADNPIALSNLGLIYYKRGDMNKCLEVNIELLRKDPKSYSACIYISEIYTDRENLKEAKIYAYKAIKIDPKKALGYYNKGIIDLKDNRIEIAAREFKKAISIDSSMSNSYMYLSIIECIRCNYIISKKLITKALEINPDCTYSKVIEKILDKRYQDKTKNKTNSIYTIPKEEYPLQYYRAVEPGVVDYLYKLKTIDLSNDLRRNTRGNAKTSDYALLSRDKVLNQLLEKDLINIAELAVRQNIYIQDSWFTILSNGGFVRKHRHLTPISRIQPFGISDQQYSLVYYLDVGDQKCSKPGYLKFYEPNKLILPNNGMVVIFKADRYHSVEYNGTMDRVMIALNFWAI